MIQMRSGRQTALVYRRIKTVPKSRALGGFITLGVAKDHSEPKLLTLIRLIYFVRCRILAVVIGDDDSFSTDTSVALITAKTASPFLRSIRLTEPVVIIEVTGPAAVLMTISETTLSDTISSIVPGT